MSQTMVAQANNFPPCTASACTVDEDEKQRAAEAAASRPSCEMTEKCVNACSAYGRVCPCAARIASHAACDAMKELTEKSRIFPTEKPDFPYLDAEDIVIGEKLGQGGFSNVNHCVVTTGEEAGQEFAIKYLKRKAMVDLHQFKHGAADLAVEAFFLNQLNHENIVKLHGLTAGSVETNVASGKECGFFIVVDRLYDTLERRLEQWREEQEENAGSLLSRFSSDFKEKKKKELMKRIRIAYSIANAMEYLHSLNIVYRDLKPDNIGFDKDGVLKLFDFGLAKELKPEDEKPDGRYELTGNTGSRRYMAPEVAKESPYDKSVDVYSFGILLWELCSAEKPFFGYSSGKHMQQVVIGGERPKMDSSHVEFWPLNLQWLMKRCWSPFPAARPSFTDIKQVLQDILLSKEGIPESLANLSELDAADDPSEETHGGGFGIFFRSPKPRSSSVIHKSPPKTFESVKRPAKSGRSRTWGFMSRR